MLVIMEEKKREIEGNNTRGTRQEKGQGSLNGAEPKWYAKMIMDNLFGTFFALFIVNESLLLLYVYMLAITHGFASCFICTGFTFSKLTTREVMTNESLFFSSVVL